VQSVMDATHERPWLWAVLIVVIVLPLVLIVVYCCVGSSSKVSSLSLSLLFTTSQLAQLSLASLRGRLSSTSVGWGKGGNVTSAGWQVTL